MIRLNEHNRRVIRERILNHAFDERAKALDAALHKAGQAIYADVYPDDVRRKMKAMPDGFLPTDTNFEVQVEGERFTTTVHWDERRLVSFYHMQNGVAGSYVKDEPLLKEYLRVSDLLTGLRKERSSKEESVGGILSSVQSIAALAKVWPEAEKFFADFRATTPSGGALARDLRKLNDALGLPPTEAK